MKVSADAWTDGSYRRRHQRYSWGLLFRHPNGTTVELSGSGNEKALLQNGDFAGEARAVLEAIRHAAKTGCEAVIIHHDRLDLDPNHWNLKRHRNSVMEWYAQELMRAKQSVQVAFQWVKGHSGNTQNMRADSLARHGVAMRPLPYDQEVYETGMTYVCPTNEPNRDLCGAIGHVFAGSAKARFAPAENSGKCFKLFRDAACVHGVTDFPFFSVVLCNPSIPHDAGQLLNWVRKVLQCVLGDDGPLFCVGIFSKQETLHAYVVVNGVGPDGMVLPDKDSMIDLLCKFSVRCALSEHAAAETGAVSDDIRRECFGVLQDNAKALARILDPALTDVDGETRMRSLSIIEEAVQILKRIVFV